MPRPLPYLRFYADAELETARAAVDVILRQLKEDRRAVWNRGGVHAEYRYSVFTREVRRYAGLRAQLTRLLRDRNADAAYLASAEGSRARAAAPARWHAALKK